MTNLIAAIGDIHGCSKQMDSIIEMIRLTFSGRKGKIVFLGDYVDRGPDSKGVIDRLMNWNDPLIDIVLLRGNHEDMMIKDLIHNDFNMGNTWRGNGGMATIFSIGHEDVEYYAKWLNRNTVVRYEEDNLIFVHAGLNPSNPTDDQKDTDMMWIRNEFLHSGHNFGKRVVHGHTPRSDVEVCFNRINLDTGCCYGGKLSAAIFEDGNLITTLETK
jgi:serine/threonine protein phosphatase 1